MYDRPCVTIDAAVLAVPHIDCVKDEAFQYIDTLLDWRKLLNESWIAIHLSEYASEALFADSLFPMREQLKELFNIHGIVEFDANTVATIAIQLLKLTPSFETYFRINDVLFEKIETSPDIIRLTTHSGIQSNLARCITLVAILRKYCSQPLGGHSLLLKKAPQQVIHIRAQIHDLEHTRDDIVAFPCAPEYFEGEVLACDDFHGLIKCLDETVILADASDNLGIEVAIRIALCKYSIAKGESSGWRDTLIPKIGGEFREICQKCCTNHGDSLRPKILRAIVETIEDQNLQAVHAIRTGPGGSNPQRLRGSDKAQRRNIDRNFRLHYWECADGTIELASVVSHNQYSIPE